MIIKLTLADAQLEALHAALSDKSNFYLSPDARNTKKRSFVWVKSVKSVGADQTDCPVPMYSVSLEASETYVLEGTGHKFFLTPLARLTHVLQAIGRFPDEDRQLVR